MKSGAFAGIAPLGLERRESLSRLVRAFVNEVLTQPIVGGMTLAQHLQDAHHSNCATTESPRTLAIAIDEGVDMTRTIYALMVLIITLASVVKSQTPTANPKNTTIPSDKQTGSQSNSMIEDCACDSQILPKTAAIVNVIQITGTGAV